MRPRIGCLGLGWIGRHRLQSLAESGLVEVVAIADVSPDAIAAARTLAPAARCCESLAALLSVPLDGVVIATPSAQHASEVLQALDAGRAVFCQKPLARSRDEAQLVVDHARACNRLLHVDLSYRHLRATSAVTTLLLSGELGDVFAFDLTFHNAYGPDKPWYYDRQRSGGGCVLDLGIHLIDLLHGWTGGDDLDIVASALASHGRQWTAFDVEDFAYVQLRSRRKGALARLACSWKLQAGCDAEIVFTIHGTRAGARVRNVGGSFFDFVAERLDRSRTERLTSPPDDWSGRAALEWALRLAESPAFDASAEWLVRLSGIIDQIYASAAPAEHGAGLTSLRQGSGGPR